MEYTDYFVSKVDAESLRTRLAGKGGLIIDGLDGFCPFVVDDDEGVLARIEWVLRVFDAEGSAWGFNLWVNGQEIAAATYGVNAEWGIDRSDNGFKGEKSEAAAALGISVEQLDGCLNAESATEFCRVVGFPHQYMLYPHENEMPSPVALVSELG